MMAWNCEHDSGLTLAAKSLGSLAVDFCESTVCRFG